MRWTLAFALFLCSTAVAVALLVFAFHLNRRRSYQMEGFARRFGLFFASTARPFEGTDVQGLTLLNDGCSTMVNNVCERIANGCRMLMFDLTSDCDITTVITTVAAFHCPGRHLPVFHIGRSLIMEKAEEVIHSRKIQDCARTFTVDAEDAAATRTFVTRAKLELLLSHSQRFDIDCSHDWILVYQPGKQVAVSNLPKFVSHASSVVSTLLMDPYVPGATA